MDGASSHHKYLDFINKHEDHITMNNKWNNEKWILKWYSNFMTWEAKPTEEKLKITSYHRESHADFTKDVDLLPCIVRARLEITIFASQHVRVMCVFMFINVGIKQQLVWLKTQIQKECSYTLLDEPRLHKNLKPFGAVRNVRRHDILSWFLM